MGLMGTLAKVAIGYAAARGMDRMTDGQGIGALLGGGAARPTDDPMAQAQAQVAGTPNPLQQLMSGLGGAGGAGGNPLAALMGGAGGEGGNPLAALMGGAGGAAGLAGLAGAATSAGGGGLGAMLDAFSQAPAAPEAEEAAGLMLRAMIQAAKSDGGIDEAEKARILEAVGDASAEDMAFVQAQLAAPVDAAALAADTPEAQRMQVYSASLMTIRVDTEAEAAYLDALARGMGLDQPTVNALHMQMGLQPLYG